MPIDSSIYAQFAPRPKGALDYAQEFAGLDAARQAQQAGTLQQQANQAKFDEYQRGVQKASALEQLMGSMAGKPEAEVLQGLRGAGRYSEAGAMEASMLDRQKKATDIREGVGKAAKSEFETKEAKKKQAILDIAVLPDFDGARASISAKVASGELPMQMAQGILQSMPQDPAQFATWKNNLILKMAAPEAQLSAQTQTRGQDMSAQTAAAQQALTRETAAQADARIRAEGAANRAVQMRGQNLTDARANQPRPAVPAKPMPASALKMQQEELDAIGISAKLDSTLANVERQLVNGELKLGPIRNLASLARNMAGMSSDESRKFAVFKTAIEGMRNDVLMMHKGVQTEGDAQRAMKTLIDNLNDPGVVAAQLARLRDLQQRAVTLRQNNVELIRRNYGQPDIDMTPYAGGDNKPPNLPPADAIAAELARRRAQGQ